MLGTLRLSSHLAILLGWIWRGCADDGLGTLGGVYRQETAGGRGQNMDGAVERGVNTSKIPVN